MKHAPAGFWSDQRNATAFFDWLAVQLGIEARSALAWGSIPRLQRVRRCSPHLRLLYQVIKSHGGVSLMAKHGGSPIRALMAAYPHLDWAPEVVRVLPRDYWDDLPARERFLSRLGVRLGYLQPSDWYRMTRRQLIASGASGLLARYGDSPREVLRSVWPDAENGWLPWRFSSSVRSFWSHPVRRRQFLDWLRQRLGWGPNLDSLYQLSPQLLHQHGGKSLLRYHAFSTARAVQDLYPEHQWQPWRFTHAPRSTWHDATSLYSFFEWIRAEALNIEIPQIASFPRDVIKALGGGRFLRAHANSVPKMLQSAYPNLHLDSQKTSTDLSERSRPLWADPVRLRRFLDIAAESLMLTDATEWQRVAVSHLRKLSRSSLGAVPLHGLLFAAYPEHADLWNQIAPQLRAQGGKRSTQRRLLAVVRSLFPDAIVLEEAILELEKAEVVDSESPDQMRMTFDIFLPNLRLALEYQGAQHYADTAVFGPSQLYQERDSAKRLVCAQRGVTMVEVPYWWDGRTEPLARTLRALRPDLNLTQACV